MNDTWANHAALKCDGVSCAHQARDLADILASTGALRVLEALHFSRRALRFNEIQKSIGISRKELSRQLAKLERQELISRKSFGAKAPYRVEYSLLLRGDSLLDILQTLSKN